MAVFTRILIANRSEIARRIIRTCRAMGIETVAVFTPPDADAPFVHEADAAVGLIGVAGYLNIEAIVGAARVTGCDAVHPGYGFLAENPELARAVVDAGLTFIGPAAETIAAMGDKIEALAMMNAAGVPVLARSTVADGVDVLLAGDEVGYPLLVKASRGGGGKGMRVVQTSADLTQAIEGASREASSSFGDGTVFLERFVEHARHVEVQIFGDRYGNVVHIYDRECTVQRRFQKVIEEAPAPFLPDDVRHGLWDAAVAAARAVGYVGAGTVEFIVEPDGRFAFLEMNTRLQVEHTVTEETTGLDLVRMQIEVASGASVPSQDEMAHVTGHAIEVRLYAEVPSDGYTPSTGAIVRFRVPDGVRVDTGIEDGSVISHHYDPMVAKIISSGSSRHEAVRILANALARAEIHGIETNRDLLVDALRRPDFLTGPVHTNWLDTARSEMPAIDERGTLISAAAATLSIAQRNRREALVLASIPSGWRNVRSQPMSLTLGSPSGPLDVSYVVHAGGVEVSVGDVPLDITGVAAVDDGLVDMSIDGVRVHFSIHLVGRDVYVDSFLGARRFSVIPRFPVSTRADAASGSLTASTPGEVVAIAVSLGDVVAYGDVLVVIESMKMEQSVTAPAAGRITAVACEVGDNVSADDVLIEIDEQDGSDG